MADLLPLFVNLTGRRVVLIGGGPVAAGKLRQLIESGADQRHMAHHRSRSTAEGS